MSRRQSDDWLIKRGPRADSLASRATAKQQVSHSPCRAQQALPRGSLPGLGGDDRYVEAIRSGADLEEGAVAFLAEVANPFRLRRRLTAFQHRGAVLRGEVDGRRRVRGDS